jgi:hypothetical protein
MTGFLVAMGSIAVLGIGAFLFVWIGAGRLEKAEEDSGSPPPPASR